MTPDPGALHQRPWLGFTEALAAATLWGTSGVFSVHLFRQGVSPHGVALLRPALGLAFLALAILAWQPSALKIGRRGLVVLLAAGGATVGTFQLAYQQSIDAIGVPSTVALLYLSPIIVVSASGPLLGEWPSRARVAISLAVVGGVWLCVLGAEDVTTEFGSSGLWWGVLAAFCYSGYMMLGRYASPRWGSMPTVFFSTAGATLLLAVLVPSLGSTELLPRSGGAWLLLAVYALLTVAAAQFLIFDALHRVEASRVAVASSVEPVVAALLATFFLDQGLRPLGWMGLGIVVLGVASVGLSRARRAFSA